MNTSNLISGIGTGLNFVSNLANTISQNVWADKNFKEEQKHFDYQKALQQQIFNREDTSVQRRMNDLQNAGLNPNLAGSNGAGSGSVVQTSAPQRQNTDVMPNLDYQKALLDVKRANLETELLQEEVNNKKIDVKSKKTNMALTQAMEKKALQDINESLSRVNLNNSNISLNEVKRVMQNLENEWLTARNENKDLYSYNQAMRYKMDNLKSYQEMLQTKQILDFYFDRSEMAIGNVMNGLDLPGMMYNRPEIDKNGIPQGGSFFARQLAYDVALQSLKQTQSQKLLERVIKDKNFDNTMRVLDLLGGIGSNIGGKALQGAMFKYW